MNSEMMGLLVLAGIAVFLVLKLKSVLGTRDGFEPTQAAVPSPLPRSERRLQVVENGPDRDVIDHVAEGSPAANALLAMKKAEPTFAVGDFLRGARSAYEMIVMAFERGDLSGVSTFVDDDILEAMQTVIDDRAARGVTVEAEFIGIREIALADATFDENTKYAEISVRMVGEMTSAVRDASGEIVEGSATAVKKQRDVWTFGRTMGTDNLNWQLVETGE